MKAIVFTVLLALSFTATLAVEAQPQGKVPRIGILTPASEASTPLWEAFRHGLRDLGYVEGKTILLEYRFAAGKNERLPAAGCRAGASQGGYYCGRRRRSDSGGEGCYRDHSHRHDISG